ncbi:hypothetical protein KCP69_11140 [Salmonella enterica subsp. enterica]|nr:hypothetical protein KCP69_11140 [Salmonella enterica subsp. enterica]
MRRARDSGHRAYTGSWATSAIVTLPVLRRYGVSTYKIPASLQHVEMLLLSFLPHDWQYTP